MNVDTSEIAGFDNQCSVCDWEGHKKFDGKWYCEYHYDEKVAREALW